MKFMQRKRTYPVADFGIDPRGISSGAADTVKQLHKHGHEAYIVGGAVRDLVLGKHPKDFDVATAALPEQVFEIFGHKSRIIGSRFRLVQVRSRSEIIEVSTFRTAPPKRKLGAGYILDDNTYGNNARDDAFRRDLTANGLLLDLESLKIIDYVGGVGDLRKGRLSAIGNPKRRYQEDPVRMLRTVRLATNLNLKITSATAAPIRKMTSLLKVTPSQRQMGEVIKILQSGASQKAFVQLEEYGLSALLFPHLEKFGPSERRFVDLALAHVDCLQRTNGRASLRFAVAAMFWPVISVGFERACQRRLSLKQCLDIFSKSGLYENSLINHKTTEQACGLMLAMRDLYVHYKTDRAGRMLTPEVKLRLLPEALAFEKLRVVAGEADHDVLDWWRTLAEADTSKVEAILESQPARRASADKPKHSAVAGP